MTTATTPILLTPAEIARLSDETGRHYELIDGGLVEKPMSTRANWLASRISHLLQLAYPPARAFVFTEQPTYCFADPRQMRKPDVALVWSERLPAGSDDDELHIAPDFVAEVVSPTNTFDDQLDRVASYLEAGVPLVWVVQPRRRWVHVFRRSGPAALYRAADTIDQEPLLPGLSLPVADLFPVAPVTPPAL
jgi:Uma2 family endonuclease